MTSDRLDKAQIEDAPEIQSEILGSLVQPTETVTLTAEAWKGWRKAAGLHVDPETAEVCWDCVPVGDPYGLRPPSAADLDSVGPMYFARSSESSKWIEFNDLPEATRKAPAPEGEYFCASIWKWHLLAKLVTALCPHETSSSKHWYSNDGDGLGSAEALALADALERKLQSGEFAAALCDPNLISNTEPPIAAPLKAWFGSQGLDVLHEEAVVEEHLVARFPAFVRASGGFNIW